ncbi:hypothetical protein [Azospirillum endophyticum]
MQLACRCRPLLEGSADGLTEDDLTVPDRPSAIIPRFA